MEEDEEYAGSKVSYASRKKSRPDTITYKAKTLFKKKWEIYNKKISFFLKNFKQLIDL